MNQFFTNRLLIATGATLLSTSAFAIQIDTFGDTTAHVVASQTTGSPASNATVVTPFAIGGIRTMTASGGTGSLGTLGIANDGTLQYANTPVSAGTLLISYGTGGSLGAGVDLTDGGASNGFFFTIDFADAPVDYSIVLAGGGGSASGTFPTEILNPGDEQTVFIPFADFSGSDFTQVTAIDITLSPNGGIKGADLTISDISTGFVPEPTSLALMSLGGLLIARRRRA